FALGRAAFGRGTVWRTEIARREVSAGCATARRFTAAGNDKTEQSAGAESSESVSELVSHDHALPSRSRASGGDRDTVGTTRRYITVRNGQREVEGPRLTARKVQVRLHLRGQWRPIDGPFVTKRRRTRVGIVRGTRHGDGST